MASDAVEFVLRARDESRAVIDKARTGILGLTGAVGDLALKAGTLGALTAGITAVAGAVLAAGKHFADAVESLDRMSQATGAPIDRIQVLREVFERAGLAAEDADKALTFMARAIGRQDPILAKLGITTRDVWQATLQLGDAFARGGDFAAKQEIVFKVLGRSSAQAVGTLDTLRSSVDQVGKQMQEMGGIMSPEVAEKARVLDRQLDDLSTAWHSMTTRSLVVIAPWAIKTITVMEAVGKATLALTQQMALFFDVVSGRVNLFDRAVRQDTIERLQTFVREMTKAIAASEGVISGGTPGGGASPTAAGDAALRAAAAAPGSSRRHAAGKSEDLLVGSRESAQSLADDYRRLNAVLELTNAQIDRQVEGLALAQEGMTAQRRAALEASTVLLEWQVAADAVTSRAAVLSQSLGAVWSGLEAGFSAAAAQLTARWKYSANLINNITHALVDEMIQTFARIAAAEVFSWLLPGFGQLAGIATGAGPIVGGHPLPESAGRGRVGPTVVINLQAMDAQSVERSLRSPDGALRQALRSIGLRGPRG